MKCKKSLSLLAGILAIACLPVWAGDLSSDVRKGASDPHAGDGNYLELELGVGAFTCAVYGIPEDAEPNVTNYEGLISLNMHFQYKGWFVEGFTQSLEQFTLGYNFADGEGWSLDAVALEQHPEISADISSDLEGLKAREADYMFGLRATGYYENYIVQLHTLTDISEVHKGEVYSAKIARHWQHKNWNFHAIVGASYRTQSVADYYFSVRAADVTEKFYEFRAQAGFTSVFELGATYPINQKWVYRGLIRHVELDHQWLGSPLIISDHSDIFMNSISYVF